jgi:hypothetical protein
VFRIKPGAAKVPLKRAPVNSDVVPHVNPKEVWMTKLFRLTFLITCLAFTCLSIRAQSAAPLTNKDVIDLVKMGMSSDVIVAKIKNSPSNFDTSLAALQDLKMANVPEPVILAMVNAPNANGSSSAADKSPARAGVKNLYEVQKIYVDEMGKSDDSDRFRLLVREKLADKGFTMVDTPDEADGILKGSLATQLSQGTTKARASVLLKSQSGTTLWSDDFGVRFAFGPHRDSIKLRAEDVADGLHGAWKKSAKQAGIKTK